MPTKRNKENQHIRKTKRKLGGSPVKSTSTSPIMTSTTIASAISKMTTKSEADEVAETFSEKAEISVEDTTTETPKKCRKDVENNGFELIFALCACDSSIGNKSDIMNATFTNYNGKLMGCSEPDFEKYKKDVDTRKPKVVDQYIRNLKSAFSDIINDEVKHVYLEGKTLTTQKLKDLNSGFDTKQAKSDVYVETDKEIIGFSIKQDKSCTKTNFSVEKMLGELISDAILKKNFKKEIANKRKEVLTANGINNKNLKDNRDKANEIFYDSLERTNLYWNALKEHLDNNSEAIKNELVRNLFPTNLPYKLYEFDGSTIEKLDVSSDDKTEFYEHSKYYFDDKNRRRKAAKMFYKLVVNDKKYRIEIRFKGNAWSGAPQFQTHYDPHTTPKGSLEDKKISPSKTSTP
jgi:hypothetical protein